MRTSVTPRTIRRLLAADGYLQLDLPQLASAELEKAGEAGILEGPRQLLLGLAYKRDGHIEVAIDHLETAARTMPAEARRFAWSELVDCYRHIGSDELADFAVTLSGEKSYELRIALPFGEIQLESTETACEIA